MARFQRWTLCYGTPKPSLNRFTSGVLQHNTSAHQFTMQPMRHIGGTTILNLSRGGFFGDMSVKIYNAFSYFYNFLRLITSLREFVITSQMLVWGHRTVEYLRWIQQYLWCWNYRLWDASYLSSSTGIIDGKKTATAIEVHNISNAVTS